MEGPVSPEPQPSPQMAALTAYRKQLGVTASQAAYAIQISGARLSKAEAGYCKLSDMQVVRYADFLCRRAESLSRALPQATEELQTIRQGVPA